MRVPGTCPTCDEQGVKDLVATVNVVIRANEEHGPETEWTRGLISGLKLARDIALLDETGGE